MQVTDVHTREDLVKFLEAMSRDREAGKGSWANPGLADYLSAVARWTEGMEQVYKNTGRTMPRDVDWGFVATLFHIGRIYE